MFSQACLKGAINRPTLPGIINTLLDFISVINSIVTSMNAPVRYPLWRLAVSGTGKRGKIIEINGA